MKKLDWLFLTIFTVTLFGCSDDDDGVLDTSGPDVTITSPTEGQSFTFTQGEEHVIELDFRVEDDFGLEEVFLWVTPQGGTRQEVENWDVNDFLNDDTEFERDDYDLRIGTPTEGTYTITVEGVDDQGNRDESSVTVTLMAGTGGESSISLEGIEEGETYTIGTQNEVSYMIMDEQGVDSVQVILVSMEDDTLVNQWYGETYFSENVEDNTNITITDNLNIPNTAMEAEHTLVVNTYRNGEVVNTQETNITTTADANARRVNFNVTPPESFDPNSSIYVSGNFQGTDVYTNDYDPAYELNYDETTGIYSTSIYANPDQDFNYRYSTIDAAGNMSTEVDDACLEAGDGVYNRSYVYADGDADADGIDDIDDVDVNFTGYGDCL